MSRQNPQVVSPASSTPPLMARRGRGSTDSQGDGSSDSPQARNTFMAGEAPRNSPNTDSANSSQKERKDRQDSIVFSVRQAPAMRTLDSWFVQDPRTPAPRISGRSPLRSLSPDAPVVSESSRSISILGRPPSPEKARKGRLVDLSGSPSSVLSSRGLTSGSTAVATVTPPGPKSSRDGGLVVRVRSHAIVSTIPSPPSGDNELALVARQAVNGPLEEESTRTLAGASSSAGRSTKRRPPADATAFGSLAKSKQRGAARGMDTFTRISIETTSKDTTPEEPDHGSHKIASSAAAKPEHEESVEDSAIPSAATPAEELSAPCASSPSGRRLRGRPTKRRNSAPDNSGSVTDRTPLAPRRSHRVTDDSGVSSSSTSTAVSSGAEEARAGSTTTVSSGEPATARTPVSKTPAKKKQKAAQRPVVPGGPLVVGAGGGSGWRKKEQPGDGRKGGKSKQRSSKGGRSGQIAQEEDTGGGASATPVSAGKVKTQELSGGKGGGVRMVISKRYEKRAPVKIDVAEVAGEGGGVSAPERQSATTPKKRRAASMDEAQEAVIKKSCRRGADGDGNDGVAPPAGRGDNPETQKAVPPLAGAAATAEGTLGVTNAQLSPAMTVSNEAMVSEGALSIPASQTAVHLGSSPANATPFRTVAATSTVTTVGVSSTACESGVKQETSERLAEASPVAAAAAATTGGRVWTPLATAGGSAAMMSKAPHSEGEVEAHLMVGDGLHLKCRHCKARFARAGCSTGSCVDCCYQAAVPCSAHAKQLERKRLEEKLLAAGPGRKHRRLAKGVFKEEAIHATGDTATVWCFMDFLCARSNQGAFTALIRTQRAAKGRMPRSSARGVTSEPGDAIGAPAGKKGGSGVVGGKCRRVRPSLARWRLKNEQMLAALAARSEPSP